MQRLRLQIEGDGFEWSRDWDLVQGSTHRYATSTMDRNNFIGRAFVDRKRSTFLTSSGSFDLLEAVPRSGYRTMLGTPLLREEDSIGVIAIRVAPRFGHLPQAKSICSKLLPTRR